LRTAKPNLGIAQFRYESIEQLTSKFKETKEEAYDKFREIHNIINPAKLEASMKVQYEIEVKIDKSIEIDIAEDTKNIADIILNFIRGIGDKAFAT